MNSNTNFSCSSWNYGAYSISNPYFTQVAKPSTIPNNTPYIPKINNNSYNKFGKRILREEERIVTNDYMSTINHMKKIKESEMQKGKKKTKKKKELKEQNKEDNQVNEENTELENSNIKNKPVDIKTDTTDYKFRLSYDEWMEVKRKQQMIFNQIKKIKEGEHRIKLKVKKL